MNDENENTVKKEVNLTEIEEKEKSKEEHKRNKSQFLGLIFSRKKSLKTTKLHEHFLENFHHKNEEVIPKLNNRMNPLKNCISALSFSKSIRNKNNQLLESIESYLKTLPGLMNIISNEQNKYTMDEKLKQISINMQYEFYSKNTVMFKYGDKGDKFYIILKGKIGFLIPKKIKCSLNEEEYLTNLVKLYQNGESEIIRNILRINQQIFDFGEDFEKYITETINEFYRRNKNHKYSMDLYNKLIELSSNNLKTQNNIKNSNNISIQGYIEMNKIINGSSNVKNKRTVILYNYQYVNSYEDGQTFGYMALESRNNKRTSTALALTDCELASLTKEEYFEFLGGVHHKTRNNLYDLINSLKVLGNISKPTFDYDVIHKIKFINYKTNETIIEEKKFFNLFYIFYNGSFKLTVNKNIIELNELIIKLKKIRGKILGLPDEFIQKDINEQILEIDGNNYNKAYSDKSIKKEYLKKHNFIISLISDSFLLGLPDTIDPETNLSLFNCTCISNFCDGYEISNKVFQMLCKGEHYKFNNDVMQTSLTKINYYIKRIYRFKNALLVNIKNMASFLAKKERSVINKTNNKHYLKALHSEPKHKSLNNSKQKINIIINNKNCNNKEKEKKNHKSLICKTTENLKLRKSLKIQVHHTPNIKLMKTTTNFKNLDRNTFFKTKKSGEIKFIPNLYQKRVSKSINMNVMKNKLTKYRNSQNLKLTEHKAILDIFNKKKENKNETEDDLSESYHENKCLNQKYLNVKYLTRNHIDNDLSKEMKKENKYLKLYEDFMITQKTYKNNANINLTLFNPVDEKIKNNRFSIYSEYKKIPVKSNNIDNNDSTIEVVNSLNIKDNIDYFLSREKAKGNIFLNLEI